MSIEFLPMRPVPPATSPLAMSVAFSTLSDDLPTACVAMPPAEPSRSFFWLSPMRVSYSLSRLRVHSQVWLRPPAEVARVYARVNSRAQRSPTRVHERSFRDSQPNALAVYQAMSANSRSTCSPVIQHNDKGLSPTSEHAAAHQEAGV